MGRLSFSWATDPPSSSFIPSVVLSPLWSEPMQEKAWRKLKLLHHILIVRLHLFCCSLITLASTLQFYHLIMCLRRHSIQRGQKDLRSQASTKSLGMCPVGKEGHYTSSLVLSTFSLMTNHFLLRFPLLKPQWRSYLRCLATDSQGQPKVYGEAVVHLGP